MSQKLAKYHTSLARALVVVLSASGLTACGGGGDNGISNMATTAGVGESQPPESVTILELQKAPTFQVPAGTYFLATFSIRCEGHEGKCLKPVQVGRFTTTFGVIEQVLYRPVGGSVRNFVGTQSEKTFVPATAVAVDWSGVIEVYVKTGPGDVAQAPQEWTITATDLQGASSVEVVGVQTIEVVPAPRRIDL